MARFYKRYRKYKRGYRRFKTLSKYNIYMNKGARSQARQINALNRKISRVYKLTKPEVKQLTTSPVVQTFTSQTLSGIFVNYSIPYINLGNQDGQRIGDKITLTSCRFYSELEYFNNSSTGYHDSESAGCVIRFILLQLKQPGVISEPVSLTDIFQYATNTGSTYTALATMNYREGITEKWRILGDKKVILTTDRNQAVICMSAPMKPRVKTIRYANPTSSQQIVGNNIILLIVATGLHWDTNFQETVQITTHNKLTWTDA